MVNAQRDFEELVGISKDEFILLTNEERISLIKNRIADIETREKIQRWEQQIADAYARAEARSMNSPSDSGGESASGLDSSLAIEAGWYKEFVKLLTMPWGGISVNLFNDKILYPYARNQGSAR